MNRKAIIAGLTMVAGIGAYGMTQEANACGLGVTEFEVKATSLNVRPEPNTSKLPIGKLTRGQKVVPYEKSGNWGKIKLSNGKEGWVSMDYLKSLDNHNIPTDDNSATTINKKVVVTANSLNLRAQPNTSSQIYGKLSKGKTLMALKQTGAWLYVEDGHINGWVHSDYVKDTNNNSNSNDNTSNDSTSNKKWTGVVFGLNGKRLNVRYDASTGSSVKGYLNEGDTVEVQHEVNRGGRTWLRIKYNGSNYGYVAKEYVKVKTNEVDKPSVETPSKPSENTPSTPSESKPSTPSNSDLTGEVYDEVTGELRWFERTVYAPAGDPLNIRTQPNANSSVITKVVRHSKIFVGGESKSNPGWYKVSGVDGQGNAFEGWAHSKYIF